MIAHLPILQVIIPLMAAPICLMLKRTQLVWFFSIIASGLAFAVSILLLQQVMASGVISYELGGWQAPWGIEYRIDKLNAFVFYYPYRSKHKQITMRFLKKQKH